MDYKHLASFVLKKIKLDNIGAYAAQAALFIIMSAIPFLLVFLSIIRFTPVTESMILSGIEILLPGNMSPTLVYIVDEVYYNSGKILPMAAIFAIYSAAKAVQSLRYGLNIVYDIEETRNWFVLRFRAMIETFVLILVISLLMLLMVFGRKIQNLLVEYTPIIAVVTEMILKLRMVILFFVLILFFTSIYKFLPNRKATFRSQLVGAIGCSVAWYVFSFGLSIYVNYFNGFSLYGSLTTILLLMFWLYISMYIFLVCGEINNVFEVIIMEIKSSRKRKLE
jgi:membrane protein